jgi:uncharacterized membrane protein YgcG
MAATLLVLITGASLVAAQGPPFSDRPEGTHIVDEARVFPNGPQRGLEETLRQVFERRGVDLVVLTQVKPGAGGREEAQADADALLAQWRVGGRRGDGAVMLWNLDRQRRSAEVGLAIGDGLTTRMDAAEVGDELDEVMATALGSGDWLAAVTQGIVTLSLGIGDAEAPAVTPAPDGEPERTARPRATPEVGSARQPLPTLGPVPPAGPPYPEPIAGLRVYDYASVLRRDTEVAVSEMIEDIEERTGAQIVVYTQVKPESDSLADAERDAAALMDQWGVGRRGFDDGLVVLFDLTQDRCHGQLAIYAGAGYEAAFLSRAERQRIFEEEALPALGECDFDSAVLFMMERFDDSATPEHAATLQLARQVDAATGLVAAPLVLVLLVAWAGWSWVRYGRDPEYLDDASIHMPAPPPGMTPAVATVVLDGRASRRSLTTALVDLASRGDISFRESGEADQRRVDVRLTVPDEADSRLARNRRSSLGEVEQQVLGSLRELGGSARVVSGDALVRFASGSGTIVDRLDAVAAQRGWFREPPERSVERWSYRGGVVVILGAVAAFLGLVLPSSGLLLLGAAMLVAAVCIFILARVMPQRTLEGARMYAQLAAYRRTLEKTLARSRTMDQVVSARVLPWVQTPDQAVVWSYALGLHEEVEELLERSMEDIRSGAASPTRTYFPGWYSAAQEGGGRNGGVARGVAAGLFSAAALPEFGRMSASLSTIVSPRTASGGGSGGGGSGRFGGGSSTGGSAAGGGF